MASLASKIRADAYATWLSDLQGAFVQLVKRHGMGDHPFWRETEILGAAEPRVRPNWADPSGDALQLLLDYQVARTAIESNVLDWPDLLRECGMLTVNPHPGDVLWLPDGGECAMVCDKSMEVCTLATIPGRVPVAAWANGKRIELVSISTRDNGQSRIREAQRTGEMDFVISPDLLDEVRRSGRFCHPSADLYPPVHLIRKAPQQHITYPTYARFTRADGQRLRPGVLA